MSKTNKRPKIQGLDIEKWTCCIDCGLIIEPITPKKTRWTICEACSKVYTKTTHPWLSKMLAHHLISPPSFLKKKNTFKNARFFMCQKCGNYYIDIENKFHNGKTVCKWCSEHCNDSLTIADRCVVCSGLLYRHPKNRRMVCKSCTPVLKNIKKVLKYICLIMCQSKQNSAKTAEVSWESIEDV